MSRCNTIIAAALAAAAFAAPTALAEPADFHAGPEFAASAHEPHSGSFRTEIADPAQDLRSADARDAARGDDIAALAQERYYSSYDTPKAAPAVALHSRDGITHLPFVLAVLGALVVGLAAGSGLHLVRVRRRQAAGLAT